MDKEKQASGFGLIRKRHLLARNLSSNFLQHFTLPELEQVFPEAFDGTQLQTVVRNPSHQLLSSFHHSNAIWPPTTSYLPTES